MSASPASELQELARSFGVQLEYRDMAGAMQPASTATLLSILRVLGADLKSEADAAMALKKRRLDRYRRGIEPVVVHWEDDGDGSVDVHIPEAEAVAELTIVLESEARPMHQWTSNLDAAVVVEVDGERFLSVRLPIPLALPTGYYQLLVSYADKPEYASSLLIRAPRQAYRGSSQQDRKPWGVFCPLYALHRESSWGAGDFSDLEALIEWTAGRGGEAGCDLADARIEL